MNIVRFVAFYLVLQSWSVLVWAVESASDISDQVKAAYLFKFAAYVDWPPATFSQDNTPVTIGVIGADGLASALTRLSVDHLVNNRTVRVKQLKVGEPLTGVQILFIGLQENGRLRRILDGVQSQPVLTVSEVAGALSNGSIINFVPVDDRIRFEVSVTCAERNGLKISARLLGIAQRVEGRGS